MFDCGELEQQWYEKIPINGMSLMAIGILGVCVFGHCQARRNSGSGSRWRRPTRSVSGESIYDPSSYRASDARRRRRSSSPGSGRFSGVGTLQGGSAGGGGVTGLLPRGAGGAGGGSGSDSEAAADLETGQDGARGSFSLPSGAADIVVAAGGKSLTMQQVTQEVLRSTKIKQQDKRHFMMLLFRHYGFAGEEEKPAPSAKASSDGGSGGGGSDGDSDGSDARDASQGRDIGGSE